MITLLHTLATEVLAAGVAYAAACRMVLMNWHDHRPPWLAIFYTMFAGGAVALFETATEGPSWSATLLLAACAGYLIHSRHTWRHGAPVWLRRDGGEGAPNAADVGLHAPEPHPPGSVVQPPPRRP